MVGTAHANRRETARYDVRDMRRFRQNHGDGSRRKRRKEMRCKRRHICSNIVRHRKIGDVEDERIVGGTPLRLIDTRTRRRVQSIRTESVDCLRWKRDERASLNQRDGTLEISVRGGAQYLRIHLIPPLRRDSKESLIIGASHGYDALSRYERKRSCRFYSVYPTTTRSMPPRSL